MQIKRLEIKNALGIKEFELEAGQVNMVKGANEAGKTSVLESIEKALRNTDRRASFVHNGAEEGTLYLEMDDGLAIDRRIKSGGKSSVKLTRDGEKVPKPESFLKQLSGEYAFNPVDFLAKKDKEQAALLLSLIPMKLTEKQMKQWFGAVPPVNLDQHPIELLTYLAEKYFYDMRTIANSEVKECENEIAALFEQLPDNYSADNWRDVEIGKLWEQVQMAQKINSHREQAAQILEAYPRDYQAVLDRYDLEINKHQKRCEEQKADLRTQVERQKQGIQDEIIELEEQVRRLQERICKKKQDQVALDDRVLVQEEALVGEMDLHSTATKVEKQKDLDDLERRNKKASAYLEENAQVDIEPLEQSAREAETMKGYIPLHDNMQRLELDLEEKSERAGLLDRNVSMARNLPAKLLAETELPVAGLGINEEMQLTVDELPIRNLSTGRQIKLALDIARATAGPLQLICIDRFESLDPINQELFFQEIKGDGYQYFISTTQLDRDEQGNYITNLTVQTRESLTV